MEAISSMKLRKFMNVTRKILKQKDERVMTDGQELNRYKLENADLKKRVEEAEGELAIIKGIGNKSPEMSALQKANQLLKKDNHELAKMNDIIREEAQVIQLQAENEIRKFTKRITDLEDVNKSHQKLNGELQVRLSKYEDKAAHYRRKAIL
jgi:hypothetical protein